MLQLYLAMCSTSDRKWKTGSASKIHIHSFLSNVVRAGRLKRALVQGTAFLVVASCAARPNSPAPNGGWSEGRKGFEGLCLFGALLNFGYQTKGAGPALLLAALSMPCSAQHLRMQL
jgi:hypothetical protein